MSSERIEPSVGSDLYDVVLLISTIYLHMFYIIERGREGGVGRVGGWNRHHSLLGVQPKH